MAQFRYIGLVVAASMALVFGLPQASHAQDVLNAGGSTAPTGFWLAGGPNASASFNHGNFGGRGYHWGPSGAGIRLEAGLPLTEVGPGELELAIPLSTVTEGHGHGLRWNSLTIAPEVQWEYAFPIHMPHRLSIAPQVGAGIGGVWVHNGEGNFMMLFKTGVVVRFVFDFGLLLETQPLGFTFNIPFGEPFDFYASYEWYAGVGYRF